MEALDQIHGPQTLVGELARFQRTDTPLRFEELLARLAAYPGWMAAHRANLAEGVAAGRTAPAEVLERCLDQTRRLVETPVPRVAHHARQRGAGRRRSERRCWPRSQEHVQPALMAWLEMLEGYAEHVRPGPGVCHLPDGDAVYRHLILAYTNLPEDPRAIHDYGLARLDEIEAAEAPIAAQLGHESVASLRVFLDRDPANHVVDPADLVKAAEAWILRAEAAAPAWFGNPPAEHCVVQAVEPHVERDAPAAFYYPPAEDGSRPGTYFFNTYDPPSRPLHQAVPMTFHEAVPGHHFQLTVERHLDGLPAFRRHGALLACGAYVEGWALYAERLAAEMGLYHTPLERFGAWESEAHRAARLVVDTGLHAFGWTRQQSIDLLVARAGLARLDAEIETDRYIAWPGQALSYMIGQREILSLRAAAGGARRRPLRPQGLPRRGHRSRLAAARRVARAAAGLGRAQIVALARRSCLCSGVGQLVQRGTEPLDLVGGVVVREADTHACRPLGEAQGPMQLPGVVVAVAHVDAALTEEPGHLGRRVAVDGEGHGGAALRRTRRIGDAVDACAGHATDACDEYASTALTRSGGWHSAPPAGVGGGSGRPCRAGPERRPG